MQKITDEKIEPSTDKDQIKKEEGNSGNVIAKESEVKIEDNAMAGNENQE